MKNGTSAGSTSASPGIRATAYARKTSVCASTTKTSWRTTPSAPPISSIFFRWGGASSKGSPTAPTYDLKQHAQFSGKALEYFDEESKQKIVPYVIEPSAGADRGTLAFLVDAYNEEEVKGEKRVVLNFHPELAPIKIAVLPLLKKNSRIVETAQKLCVDLRKRWHSVYDDTASIGRLYRRQDEVGTPFCVTVDVQTVGDDKSAADDKVTIRDRDTMGQVRVALTSLPTVMEKLMAAWADGPRFTGTTGFRKNSDRAR